MAEAELAEKGAAGGEGAAREAGGASKAAEGAALEEAAPEGAAIRAHLARAETLEGEAGAKGLQAQGTGRGTRLVLGSRRSLWLLGTTFRRRCMTHSSRKFQTPVRCHTLPAAARTTFPRKAPIETES